MKLFGAVDAELIPDPGQGNRAGAGPAGPDRPRRWRIRAACGLPGKKTETANH